MRNSSMRDFRCWSIGRERLLIDARALHTYYGASHILRGIDFTVARGETIGLMGRNGMGKSTLLKTLIGHWSSRVAVAFGSWART